jgi:hypothetical protein
MAALRRGIPTDRPEIRDRVIGIYEEEVQKAFTTENLNALIIPIYDKCFTGDELIALIAFYDTPLGKKVVEALPQIFRASSAAGEQLGREVQERVTERIGKEVMPLIETAPDSRPPAKRRPARRPRT